MKETIIYSLFVLFLFPHSQICAKPVSVDQVRNTAATMLTVAATRTQKRAVKLAETGRQQTPQMQYTLADTKEIRNKQGEVLAYVTELQPEGFIIIAADTDIRPVLGYSFKGKFPYEDSEQNALLHLVRWDVAARNKAMKTKTEAVTTLAQSNNILWDKYSSSDTATQWGPLITTNWYQGGNFDDQCPLQQTGGTSRCVVGCVATATSQILNYWRFPTEMHFGTSDAYTSQGKIGNNVVSIAIDADSAIRNFPTFTQLNTSLATINYNANSSEEAYLCFATGLKFHMDYGSESGADTAYAAVVLKDEFGYGSAERDYDTGAWDRRKATVIENIKQGWPAQLGIAEDTTNGHSVVADGYRSDDFFHINMGWSDTSSDTWYNLPSIDAGGYHFTVVRKVVYNISPAQGWSQYGADEKNSFRSSYPVPDAQPQRKWRCSMSGFTTCIVVGASGRIYAASNPANQGSGEHPCIQIISRQGTPENRISVSTSDYSIDTLVQNKHGDVYFACANGSYNTRDKTIVYKIASGTTQPVPIFQHSSPDAGWPDEIMKIDQSSNIYFTVSPYQAANGSTMYSCDGSGNLRWKRYLGAGNTAYGTFQAIGEADGQVYLTYSDQDTRDNFLVAINNTDGTINHTFTFPDKTSYVYTQPVVARDGTIYVGQYTKVYAFTPTLTQKWVRDFYPGYIVNLALNQDESALYANVGKLLSGVWHPGYIRAINTANGNVTWELEPVALGDSDNIGSMYAGINGAALFSYSYHSTGEERLVAVRDFGSYGQKLWDNEAGGEIAFGPENTIYTVPFGANKYIYAFSGVQGELMDYLDNRPPIAPSNPVPSSGSRDQPTSITLSWQCSDPDPGQDPNLSYDLFVGELGTDIFPVATMITGTSFALSGLKQGTSYAWKIVATDGQAVTEGPVWIFSTAGQAPPVISSLVPESGPRGSTVQVAGSNFGSTTGDVLFGGISTSKVLSWGDTAIQCLVPEVNAPVSLLTDDFEDGAINSSLWVVGGGKGGYGGAGAGDGQWYNQEIVDSTDGYLQARATTPASANTFGSQAWTRTVRNFNDGKDWLVQFTWEADIETVGNWHADWHLIEITDGRTDWNNGVYSDPDASVLPGTSQLYLSRGVEMARATWSIGIDHTARTATLYEGPDSNSPIHSTATLDPSLPWYVRFATSVATSMGFPAKDCRINLYDFQASVPGSSSDGQVDVQVIRADAVKSNTVPFTVTGSPHRLHDWNGDEIVSIIGDVPPFVQCVYFNNCPSGIDPLVVGDCNHDGFLSIIGDVPCFVDCVYFQKNCEN